MQDVETKKEIKAKIKQIAKGLITRKAEIQLFPTHLGSGETIYAYFECYIENKPFAGVLTQKRILLLHKPIFSDEQEVSFRPGQIQGVKKHRGILSGRIELQIGKKVIKFDSITNVEIEPF